MVQKLLKLIDNRIYYLICNVRGIYVGYITVVNAKKMSDHQRNKDRGRLQVHSVNKIPRVERVSNRSRKNNVSSSSDSSELRDRHTRESNEWGWTNDDEQTK
jgi:hypothetical protein